MVDILYVVAGVAILTTLMFGTLVFSLREGHARVRFEKIRRELKEQGRYEEWARANRVLLLIRRIINTGAIFGLPGFLFFVWLGYRQIGFAFLGIFVVCLLGLLPVNRVLYHKIYQDHK